MISDSQFTSTIENRGSLGSVGRVSTLTLESPHPVPIMTSVQTTTMQRLHNGAFLVNDTAANDPACQSAMASYMEQLRREEQRRHAIRQAAAAGNDMGQFEIWNISDRD